MASSSQAARNYPYWEEDSSSEEDDGSDNAEELSDEEDDHLLRGFMARGQPSYFESVPHPSPQDQKTLKGTDGPPRTKWTNFPPQTGTRTTAHGWTARENKPGLRSHIPAVQQANSKLEIFKLMITDEMIDDIVAWTNIKGTTETAEWNSQNPKRPRRDWLETDRVEMTAFFGLLLLAGSQRWRKQSTHGLWRSEPWAKKHPFIATMSRDRFLALMRFIRFDDKRTRPEREKTDKLAAIREYCEKLQANLYEIFEPYQNLVVDEMLLKFRGRCKFRVYMKSKPGRYGIKIWALVDVKTKFLLNFQVYLGKEGTMPEVNQGKRVVLDLTRKFYQSWRSVTGDNFFGSQAVAEELFQNGLTSVFTIRGSRKEVPNELSVYKNKPLHSSEFFWNEKNCMLVSYKGKPNKMVLLISTHHSLPLVHKDEPRKPEVIYFYNEHKPGVDTLDQMVAEYCSQRKTNRWPVKIFTGSLDLVGINSFEIWLEKNPEWHFGQKSRRQGFLEELSLEMIDPQIKRRSWAGLPRSITSSMEIMGATPPSRPDTPGTSERKPCFMCSTYNRCRKTCTLCSRPICMNHSNEVRTIVCYSCEPEGQ